MCAEIATTEQQIPAGLQQVYYYVTFDCNLRCCHCYVGENLARQSHAGFDSIVTRLRDCYQRGARKVTFLGGEPTLHPAYHSIITSAAEIGYQSIVVDTNGVAPSPLPKTLDLCEKLAIRFSFEGTNAEMHNQIRGKETFRRTLETLRSVVASGIRAEVTFTLNANNVFDVAQMIAFCHQEKISEINFHMMSLMGNGQAHKSLMLTPENILWVQQELEIFKRQSAIPVRYPKLLVREEIFAGEVQKGCTCRIFTPETLLIFPQGEMCRCPLQITPGLGAFLQVQPGHSEKFMGCPLYWRLFPDGVPEGYRMTCISWKDH